MTKETMLAEVARHVRVLNEELGGVQRGVQSLAEEMKTLREETQNNFDDIKDRISCTEKDVEGIKQHQAFMDKLFWAIFIPTNTAILLGLIKLLMEGIK